jgi:hypothetical protein
MAIVFDLVVDFGDDRLSAEICSQWFASRITPVVVDEFVIELHQPLISGYPHERPNRFQVSVVPANVGYNVALDDHRERLRLSDDQLSRLGASLYALLRGAPRYQLAMVGWDVDFLLDVNELNAEWASEIRDGTLSGLVVCKSLLPVTPSSPHFIDFDDDHVWIPYAGSKAI